MLHRLRGHLNFREASQSGNLSGSRRPRYLCTRLFWMSPNSPGRSQLWPGLQPTADGYLPRGICRAQSCCCRRGSGRAPSGRATAGEKIFDPTGSPVQIIGVVHKTSGDIVSRRPTIYFDPLGPYQHASLKGARFRAPAALPSADIELTVNFVSSSYMQALGLPLIAGHWFSNPSQFSDSCRRVGVINQEAADLFFGGRPLGAGIIDHTGGQTEIIGVVRSQDLGVFQRYAEPTLFIPAWQEYPLRMTLVLRASNANDQQMAGLRSKIESVPGRDVAAPDIETLDTQLSRSAFAPLRIATLIALASSLAALTVSMIGVFSIQSDVDRERRTTNCTRCLELRMADLIQESD